MNRVVLMGRLTKDPELRYTQGEQPMAVGRFSLAVDRRGRDKGTDFISCVAFGKTAEFIEKYFGRGSRILLEGHIQTGSYDNKDGNRVYTTDVIVDAVEFCEKNSNVVAAEPAVTPSSVGEGFMNIPDGLEDDGLPFD